MSSFLSYCENFQSTSEIILERRREKDARTCLCISCTGARAVNLREVQAPYSSCTGGTKSLIATTVEDVDRIKAEKAQLNKTIFLRGQCLPVLQLYPSLYCWFSRSGFGPDDAPPGKNFARKMEIRVSGQNSGKK